MQKCILIAMEGVEDSNDVFPTNPNEYKGTDGNGTGNDLAGDDDNNGR